MRLRKIEVGEALTASEAIKKFGLDWGVKKRGVAVWGMKNNMSSESWQVDPYTKALVRSDTGQIFSYATDRYSIVQNADMFTVLDELAGTSGAKYVNGGTYDGGRKVWLRLKLPQEFEIGGDTCKFYLKAMSSHDGSCKFILYPEVYKQICSNGMHAWVQDYSKTVAVKHVGNTVGKFYINAKKVLAKEIEYAQKFEDACRKLLETPMSYNQTYAWLNTTIFPRKIKDGLQIKRSTREHNKITEIMRSTEHGTGIDGRIRGTAWGVYSGITEWIDTQYPVRGKGDELVEARDKNASIGEGAKLREKVFEELLKLTK